MIHLLISEERSGFIVCAALSNFTTIVSLSLMVKSSDDDQRESDKKRARKKEKREKTEYL